MYLALTPVPGDSYCGRTLFSKDYSLGLLRLLPISEKRRDKIHKQVSNLVFYAQQNVQNRFIFRQCKTAKQNNNNKK